MTGLPVRSPAMTIAARLPVRSPATTLGTGLLVQSNTHELERGGRTDPGLESESEHTQQRCDEGLSFQQRPGTKAAD